MSEKNCTKCNELKLFSEFGENYKRKDGVCYRSWCKSCDNKAGIIYQRTRHGIASRIYSHQRRNSRSRNYAMPNYSLDELRDWIFSQPNFNKLFDDWVESGYSKDKTPSCDRIDDYKSYTFDNIQILTWSENNQKHYDDVKNGINNKISKAVIQLTKDGIMINEYYSINHAGRETGIERSHIGRCCRGKLKTSGGFKWRFA